MLRNIPTRAKSSVASLSEVDALILCGGQGTRLRPVVSDRPKVMADIGNRPFLEIIVKHLTSFSLQRIIFSVGYLRNQIVEYFRNYDRNKQVIFEFAEEDKPLGTGGALKNAKSFLNSEHFLVLNGDSFCPVDLLDFYNSHILNRALLSIVLSKMDDVSDYSSVQISGKKNIRSYIEKGSKKGRGLASAGIYLMQKNIFDLMPEKTSFSLEYDFFPKILDKECIGYVTGHQFIDIGTPLRYEKALKVING